MSWRKVKVLTSLGKMHQSKKDLEEAPCRFTVGAPAACQPRFRLASARGDAPLRARHPNPEPSLSNELPSKSLVFVKDSIGNVVGGDPIVLRGVLPILSFLVGALSFCEGSCTFVPPTLLYYSDLRIFWP